MSMSMSMSILWFGVVCKMNWWGVGEGKKKKKKMTNKWISCD